GEGGHDRLGPSEWISRPDQHPKTHRVRSLLHRELVALVGPQDSVAHGLWRISFAKRLLKTSRKPLHGCLERGLLFAKAAANQRWRCVALRVVKRGKRNGRHPDARGEIAAKIAVRYFALTDV